MIICLSPNDIHAVRDAQYLGALYQEDVALFEEGCFKNLKAGERITFYGHGETTDFGFSIDSGKNRTILTPEKFVEKLMEFKLPTNISFSIDLAGCQIGTIDNNKSYVLTFAQELYKNEKYRQITINAFNNLTSEIDVTSVNMVSHRETQNERVWWLNGIPRSVFQDYEAELKKIIIEENNKKNEIEKKTAEEADNNIKEIEGLINSIKSLEDGVEEKKTENKEEKEAEEKQIQEALSLIAILQEESSKIIRKCENELSEIDKALEKSIEALHDKYGKKFGQDMTDIRKELDINKNYHLTYDYYQKWLKLTDSAKSVLVILNEKMAGLTKKMASTSSFLNNSVSLTESISLSELASQVLNTTSDKELSILIEEAGKKGIFISLSEEKNATPTKDNVVKNDEEKINPKTKK